MLVRHRNLAWMLVGCFVTLSASVAAAQQVTTVQLPDDVFRPQVVVDEANTIHMVYANKAVRGDLYYMRQELGETEFTEPIQVNSTPNCAAAFNMTLGKDNRVHVVIRPNAMYSKNKLNRPPKFPDLKYMLYHRLNDDGTAFEEERDLSAGTYAFEGVGAVLADDEGTVWVYWHGLPPQDPPAMRPEIYRKIWLSKSTDEGETFSEPIATEVEPIGACACCSMQGVLGGDGKIYLLYRNSLPIEDGHKNTYLLTSADGEKFSSQLLDEFPQAGCPGSVYGLTWSASGVFAGWDTQGHVFFTKGNSDMRHIAAGDGGRPSRTPVLAVNDAGDVLFAWSQATNANRFMRVADLNWQVYDKGGRAKFDRNNVMDGAVALWSMPAVAVRPDGNFVIFHDGPGPAEANSQQDGPTAKGDHAGHDHASHDHGGRE